MLEVYKRFSSYFFVFFCRYFKTFPKKKSVVGVRHSLHHVFVFIMTWSQALFNRLRFSVFTQRYVLVGGMGRSVVL